MKNKIISIIICVCLTIGVTPVVQADTTNDYKTTYLNYAKDADENHKNRLNYASGIILVDLNRDLVPELLSFSTSVSHFDANGNKLYVGDPKHNYPAYKEEAHQIENAFSIIENKVVEDTPWVDGKVSEEIPMPFLPDEYEDDTEEFCTTVLDRSQKVHFVMYKVSETNSFYTALWYDEEGFGYEIEDFDSGFFDLYSSADLPVASLSFYDEEKEEKRTYQETMEILLSKYEDEVNTSTHASNDKNKVSDWAVAEVNKAKELNLIPPETLNDNLTENITRAEFSAIALNLHQAIVGDELDWYGGYIIDIEDNIYEMYIRGAYYFGITNGTGEKDGGVIFSPELYITREQLAVMLCRVVKLNKFENWIYGEDSDFPLDISNISRFSDHNQISDYANEAVYYMNSHGIIKGIDSSHFAPLNTATKEQAILLALRIYNAFDDLPVNQEKEKEETVAAEGVEINKEKLTLYVGDTEKLFATIIPYDATSRTIEWVSSNEDVVTVTSNGKIKAKAIGKAAISALVNEGSSTYIAQCVVTVLAENNDDSDEETNNTYTNDKTENIKRPIVVTGSDDGEDETENTSTRPTRPTVDLTTDDEDEETTNLKPTRPVVDTTIGSDDSKTETNATQKPSRPAVDASEDDNTSSSGQRPSRPSVDLSN